MAKVIYRVEGGCAICLECLSVCPAGAITIEADVSAHIDPEKCLGCGRCYRSCQAEAIVRVTNEEGKQ